MKAVLTDKYIQNLDVPARKKRIEIFDQSTPNLCVRVYTSGSKRWSVKFRDNGKQRRRTIGTYPAMSIDRARRFRLSSSDNLSN